MTTVTRRATRIVLLAVAVPLLLVCIVVSVKLASLQIVAGTAISRYEVGAYDASADAAGGLMENNLFEPWIAHFDRGTARAAAGFYNESIDDLERAFDLAPDDRRCDVALNLSLAWESLGDDYVAQGQFAGAVKLYDLARAALDAAGDGCGEQPQTGNPETSNGGVEGEGGPRSRLADKSTRAQGLDKQVQALGEPGASDPLERLDGQNRDAADEKERQQRQRDTLPSAPLPGDKPW